MFCCNAICAVWFTCLIIAEPIEHAKQHRLVEVSVAIDSGMSPDDVKSILGEPDAIYQYPDRRGLSRWLFGQRPTQWMYGTSLNLDYLFVRGLPFANPLPLNLRVLSYASEDVVIDWSSNDTVSYVRRPSFDVPPIANAMLDTVEFVDAVFHSIVLQQQ